ncbi:MAG: PEP-utilizing enzyme [Nanoarchaeota archaeon]
MKFIKWATRPSAVQRETPVAFYMTLNGLKQFYVIPVDLEKSDYYVEKESYFKLLDKIMSEVMVNPEKHLADYNKAGEIFIEKAKNVFKNLNSSPKDLLKAYEEYFNYVTEYSVYFIATFAAEEIIVPRLEALFKDKMVLITSPGKPLTYQKMQRALFEKSLEEVKKEYGWMNLYNYQEEEYDLNYFKELKKNLSKEKVDKVFEEIEKNKEDFNNFLSTVNDKKIKEQVHLMHEYAFIKTDRVDYWRRAQSYVVHFFRKLAKENNLNIKETTNLTLEEISDIILKKIIPDKKSLKLRAEKRFVMSMQKNKVALIYDEKEIDKIKKMVEDKIVNQTEFKGVTACGGYARGPAKIITDKSKLNKIRKGDILISIWTTPDYLTAMHLAEGIITEEGGLTSHAAVTSRELKKPCIMNIKNASKIIKDGDLVEVDADKGIVRILKERDK